MRLVNSEAHEKRLGFEARCAVPALQLLNDRIGDHYVGAAGILRQGAEHWGVGVRGAGSAGARAAAIAAVVCQVLGPASWVVVVDGQVRVIPAPVNQCLQPRICTLTGT